MSNTNFWRALRTPDGGFKTSLDPSGYVLVDVNAGEHIELHYLHEVVAEQYHGPRPHGAVIRHRNGDIRDNRAANLMYVAVDPATVENTGRRILVEACTHPVPDDPGDFCRVCDPDGEGEFFEPEEVMGSDGYLWVNQGRGGDYWVRCHESTAEAFNGPTPEGMEVYHLDGDVTNNVLANLGYRASDSGR